MSKGRYGEYGGQYVPETLMNAVHEVEEAYEKYKNDPEFNRELDDLLKNYAGRPSLLYEAKKMTRDLGGAKIYLKREDLNHTGAHKINNVLGQVLLAKKMGKTRVIAETGAGQHGVATATAAALMDMECEIFMGKEDTDRQALNVYRMELLGAKVHAVTSGTMTLKDAVNETMREWANRMDDTLYVLGSVMGPHPFPMIVRDFQKVIGEEIKAQMLEKEGRLPDAVIACVGGGSNAMGTFLRIHSRRQGSAVLIGCEAAGLGESIQRSTRQPSRNGTTWNLPWNEVLCSARTKTDRSHRFIRFPPDWIIRESDRSTLMLADDSGRAQYVPITDEEAVDAFEYLARDRGHHPVRVESAHADGAGEEARTDRWHKMTSIIVVTVSGRGDKDVAAIARYRGVEIYE